ncbi:hypothetical protein LCGC14_0879360 [marine sediment metagenome]|uniref:Uncharacterized protein n=1 Tax=marine sediment metagenome TaxID=412755 RepID=A0A0F9PN12_9ZZZZ
MPVGISGGRVFVRSVVSLSASYVPTKLLAAEYDPTIDKNAEYDPIISLEAKSP